MRLGNVGIAAAANPSSESEPANPNPPSHENRARKWELHAFRELEEEAAPAQGCHHCRPQRRSSSKRRRRSLEVPSWVLSIFFWFPELSFVSSLQEPNLLTDWNMISSFASDYIVLTCKITCNSSLIQQSQQSVRYVDCWDCHLFSVSSTGSCQNINKLCTFDSNLLLCYVCWHLKKNGRIVLYMDPYWAAMCLQSDNLVGWFPFQVFLRVPNGLTQVLAPVNFTSQESFLNSRVCQ